jgi:hypothetical protein
VPLIVILDLTTRVTGLPNPDIKLPGDNVQHRIVITTEYISPDDGIKHPPTPGYK